MPAAAHKLVHGLQLEVAAPEEVVQAHGRHIEESVGVHAVAVEEVVAGCQLEAGSHEVTALHVSAQEVVLLVYLLSLGEAYVHVIQLAGQVELVVQPGHFQADTRVVGALVLALHVDRGRYTHQQLVLVEAVGIALRGRHHAPRHVGQASGIEQGGDVPVIAQRLAGGVDRSSRAVEDAHFVAELVAHQSVQLHAQVEARADIGHHGVERIGHNDRGGQRQRHLRQQGFAQRGQIGVREGGLELTHAQSQLRLEGHIEPRLLQQGTPAGGGIQAEVEADFVERLAGEAQHGVGDGKAAVGHVVLVVGGVQALVVIPVVVARRLHQQVGLEDEIAFLGLDGETLAACQRYDAVGRLFFVLRPESRRQKHSYEGENQYLFHCVKSV